MSSEDQEHLPSGWGAVGKSGGLPGGRAGEAEF